MTKLLGILAIIAASVALSSPARVLCYFASWTVYRPSDGQFNVSLIDPNLCTHILYAFVGLNENGTVWVMDDWEATGLGEISHLMSLKQQNPELKVLLSMGGWNEGSEKYSKVAADPEKRAVLVQSALGYVKEHGFDGFDFDWEYPGQRGGDPDIDPANYVTILGELKSALNAEGLILSAAVTGGVASMDISYPDIAAVSDNLDMINVMAYDYHGSFENFVGHYAPLSPSHLDVTEEQQQLNVMAGLRHWLDQGADPTKVNLGVGTYGRTFTLADASNAELYAPVNGGGKPGPYTGLDGTLGYNEICLFNSDWDYIWDEEQQVPHLLSGDQWIGYDDTKSLELKVEYAMNSYVEGVMVWSLDTDDFLGACGQGKYPLLTAINNRLRAN
ncbi:Glyco hydro 18 domain containing protein [Asbolus verrucosus]|uniref:Glyco hydro 18 domain containing protein n=1 Tax=Asbolus verrucosus TaxID=1661398 RepID=A0A482V8L6_ASBVE|nr:Glyco hydro 18 domain containing protein [Asbolus verrucosus]